MAGVARACLLCMHGVGSFVTIDADCHKNICTSDTHIQVAGGPGDEKSNHKTSFTREQLSSTMVPFAIVWAAAEPISIGTGVRVTLAPNRSEKRHIAQACNNKKKKSHRRFKLDLTIVWNSVLKQRRRASAWQWLYTQQLHVISRSTPQAKHGPVNPYRYTRRRPTGQPLVKI